MKKIFFIILMASLTSCANRGYKSILTGLSKNHILLHDEVEHEIYYRFFNTNDEKYVRDLRNYRIAVKRFYEADPEIIRYLIHFRNDTTQFCNWISSANPISSKIGENDLFTKSQGALILIDNYLSNLTQSDIKKPTKEFRLTYESFLMFYNKNANLERKLIREAYMEWFHHKL